MPKPIQCRYCPRKCQSAAGRAAHERTHGPKCLCGCGATISKPSKPSLQRLFMQGHDAKLKDILLKVQRGQSGKSIPDEILAKMDEVPWLFNRPSLRDIVLKERAKRGIPQPPISPARAEVTTLLTGLKQQRVELDRKIDALETTLTLLP